MYRAGRRRLVRVSTDLTHTRSIDLSRFPRHPLGRLAPWGLCLLLFSGAAMAKDAPPTATEQGLLHESMAVWEPYLGAWEINADWTSGTGVWSRGEYRPVMAGRFVEIKTWVRDGDGPVYLRYHTLVGVGNEPGEYQAHNFTFDGKHQTLSYRTAEDGALTTEWAMGEATIRERLELQSVADGARWQVWMSQKETSDWTPLMDGRWYRMADLDQLSAADSEPSAPTTKAVRPIDSRVFAASGDQVKQITLSERIEVDRERVYDAFADAESFIAAYGPQSETLRANIDLAIGGRYEWLFDGEVGSNGCQVLAYVPGEWISFSWNAPPDHGELRSQRTWVVVSTQDIEGGTEVRLTHLGFGDGEAWDQTMDYFRKAWAYVLATIKKNLEAEAEP